MYKVNQLVIWMPYDQVVASPTMQYSSAVLPMTPSFLFHPSGIGAGDDVSILQVHPHHHGKSIPIKMLLPSLSVPYPLPSLLVPWPPGLWMAIAADLIWNAWWECAVCHHYFPARRMPLCEVTYIASNIFYILSRPVYSAGHFCCGTYKGCTPHTPMGKTAVPWTLERDQKSQNHDPFQFHSWMARRSTVWN